MRYKTCEEVVNEREKINVERKKLQEKELKEKYPNADDKFTNKEELEYSLENDLVNVKVLNNNTKLLDEKKADIASLNNVARESTPMAIENAVKNISNDVSQNLQGVAKERSDYSIEDKVKELSVELNDIKKRLTKYYTLPNLKAKRVDIKQDTGAFSNKLVVDITGKGYLCSVVDRLDFTSYNSPYIVNLGTRFKIVVDDKTIFDFQLTDSSTGRLNGDSQGGNLDIGITIIPEKETFFDSYSSSSQNYSNTFVRHRMGSFYYNGNLTPALPGDIGESFLSLDENLKSYTLNNIRLENYSKDIYQYLALLDHPLRFEKNIKVYLSSNLKGASGAQPERTNLNGHMVTYTYSLDN